MPGVLLLPSLLACNVDQGLSTRNEPPQVALASPVNQSAVPTGTPIEFIAAISDDYTALTDLAIVFASDPQGGLDGELELRDGSVRFVSEPLERTVHTITVRVTDEEAEVGEDSITLDVLPNTPPSITVLTPQAGQAFEQGSDVVVSVQASDSTEASLTALTLAWEVDGVAITGGEHPDADGLADVTVSDLDVGSHTIRVTVTDTPGDSDNATTEIDLLVPDSDGDGFTTDRLGGDDCDDNDDDVHPDAIEVCDDDDTDEDCDGLADDDDDSVEGQVEAWPDADSDGFGDPAGAYWTCEPETGVDDDQDCNDADATMNPDATEVCDDGLDNDCDGTSTSCRYAGEVDPFSADAVVYGGSGSDRAGISLDAADVDGDGVGDLVIGAYQNSSATTYAGALHVSLGPHNGERVLGTGEPTWTGEHDRVYAGTSVAALGDVDGDGWADLVTGAPDDDTDGSLSGRAYLLRGPVTTSGDLGTHDTWSGSGANSELGTSVAAAGDVDGDGLADLLLGAPLDDTLYSDGGTAYLLLGPASVTGDIDDAYDGRFRAEASKDELGTTVGSAGDVDGDGLDDMLIAAPKRNDVDTDSGVVYLVLGSATHFNGVSERMNGAHAKLLGSDYDQRAGSALESLGDLDGDGFGDLVIGAESRSAPGSAFLLRGPLTGEISLASAEITFAGTHNGSLTAHALSSGDVDGDGELDLLIGASEYPGNTDRGRVTLLHGPLLSLAAVVDLGSGLDAHWEGAVSYDHLGTGLVMWDLDADGKDELVMGAPREDSQATEAGAIFVFAGRGL